PPEVLEAPAEPAHVRAAVQLERTAPALPEMAAAAQTDAAPGFPSTVVSGAARIGSAPAPADGSPLPVPAGNGAVVGTWEQGLESEAQKLLAGGQPEVWDALTRRFE